MSKYIRTTQGIFEYKDNMSIENAVYYYFGKLEKTDIKHLFRNDKDCGEVIKQADTIEELYDRVFAFHKESQWGIPNMEGYNLEALKEEAIKEAIKEGKNSIDDFVFKLAIWTDKGLIYVAKTNDKGELELI